ncbi:uncharacterized protein [Primulina eburnea]|uniref:uncharacterized protein n=1 Tax=Primulina eburnea TaxID=1245227 RepID=UPI003C6C9FF4
MWYVITEGPMKILKANTTVAITDGAPHCIEKSREEWTTEDKRKPTLTMWLRTSYSKRWINSLSAKSKCVKLLTRYGRKLIHLCEGNEQTQENKLSVAVQNFDNIKMKVGESIHEYDERISGIINEVNALGKVYSNKEITVKVVRSFPKE